MAENKKYSSDTLSQQKKAREEFLELKKIQSGQTEAPPPPSADAIYPKTFEEKTQNFWFYYRKTVVFTILIAVILTVLIVQCVSRVDYDLGVTLYTANLASEADVKKIAEYFENFCEDVNGDDEVHVEVINCSYSTKSSSQYIQAINTKIQAIIAAEYKDVLFITDDTTYKRLNSISGDNGFFEKDDILLGNDFYHFCDCDDLFELPSGLRLSCRVISDTAMEKNKTATACHNVARKLIKKILEQQ